MKPEDYRRILEVLDELVRLGCSCDVAYGFTCDIHDKVDDVRRILARMRAKEAS